jgi:hypothetical protein
MLTPDAPVFDQSGAPSPAARHTLAEATHRPNRQPAKQVPCGSRTAGYNAKGAANPGSRADGYRAIAQYPPLTAHRVRRLSRLLYMSGGKR